MAFPLDIARGAMAPLRLDDEAALRAWVAQETRAWQWLSGDIPWQGADRPLAERVADIALAPVETLRALCADASAFSPDMIDAAHNELQRAYGDGRALVSTDPDGRAVIEAASSKPVFALGMLAQALGVRVENESADAFAGRQAWLNGQTDTLTAGIQDRLDALNRQFDDAEKTLKQKRVKAATYPMLRALERSRTRNGYWLGGLTLLAIVWALAVGHVAMTIHDLTKPQLRAVAGAAVAANVAHGADATPAAIASAPGKGKTAPTPEPKPDSKPEPKLEPKPEPEAEAAWSWPQLTERFTMFILLMTAFGWGLRWIGRFIQDAWVAGQSASRRLVALTVILDDKDKDLFQYDEKGLERIRAEIFDDPAQKSSASGKDDEGSSLELDKLLDLLKKVRELAAPNKPG